MENFFTRFFYSDHCRFFGLHAYPLWGSPKSKQAASLLCSRTMIQQGDEKKRSRSGGMNGISLIPSSYEELIAEKHLVRA